MDFVGGGCHMWRVQETIWLLFCMPVLPRPAPNLHGQNFIVWVFPEEGRKHLCFGKWIPVKTLLDMGQYIEGVDFMYLFI